MRCLYHHGDTNPAQLYFVRFIIGGHTTHLKMKEYAFKCVLLLNTKIRIVAEKKIIHFNVGLGS